MKSRFPIHIRVMAIAMLIAMFHYVAGYRLMYSVGIIFAKEAAKECLNEKNNNIKKITFTASEYASLKWSDENKEFSLDNEMYDVANIQKTGSSYIITVYCDDNETGWVTSLHSFEKELFHPDQSSKGAKATEDIMSSLQKEYTTTAEFKINIYTSTQQSDTVAVFLDGHSQQVIDSIWHPPASC